MMPYKDIFPIANAKELACRVDTYLVGHSALYIRVTQNGIKLFHLYFFGVEFISCPVFWHSAEFLLMSTQKCQEKLMQIGYPKTLAEENINSGLFKLFMVQQPNYQIQIIAGGVERLDNRD
jgi:hypothetical protein